MRDSMKSGRCGLAVTRRLFFILGLAAFALLLGAPDLCAQARGPEEEQGGLTFTADGTLALEYYDVPLG